MAERRDLTSRVLHLRSIPVAAELQPRVLHVIAAALKEHVFEAGAYLMKEGEPATAFHLLIDGSVKLVRGGKPIGKIGPPQSAGFVSVLAGGDAPYDAIAEVDTAALSLDKDGLFELMEDHTSLLVSIIRYASQRLYYEMRELPAKALAIPFDPPRQVTERPMDFVERVLFLRSLATFKKTNLNAVAALSSQLEEVRFPAGKVLFKEGDGDIATTYWIATGAVRCKASDGREWRYGPGTVLGGIEGVAEVSRWYTATVDEPMVAFSGLSHQFIELLEDDFSTARDFVAMLTSLLQRILVGKAGAGLLPLSERRDVSRLGAVPVGA